MKNKKCPLVVDLDGTLIHTDLFLESFLIYVSQNPLRLFQTVYWFFKKGRAYLKLQLAEKISLSIPSLPWNKDIIDWLKLEKAEGRTLVLATGSAQKYAEQVGAYLNLFSAVFGVSKERPHLTGKNKARFLFRLYGFKKFDYVANSFIDYPVWRLAQDCVVAYAYSFVVRQAKKLFHVVKVIPEKESLSFFQFLKKCGSWVLQVLQSRVGFSFLWIRVLSFSAVFFCYEFILNFFKNLSLNGISLLHGLFAGGLLFASAFIWGELRNLHEDRVKKKINLFSYIHLYWGALFIPLFWLGLLYAFVFLKFWWGAVIYFSLESFRFLFRLSYWFYEIMIFIFLAVWGGLLVFL